MIQTVNYLETSEVVALIRAVGRVSHYAVRDVLLMKLLWQTGARISEALQLKRGQIGNYSVLLKNLKQMKRVKGKRVHNPDAIKEVEVTVELCHDLKDYCEKNNIGEDEYVFKSHLSATGHISRTYVWNLMQKAGDLAGIMRFGKNNPRTGIKYHPPGPHFLRHSTAMRLLDELEDITVVQKHLGHASISSTNVYAYAKKTRVHKQLQTIDWNRDPNENK